MIIVIFYTVTSQLTSFTFTTVNRVRLVPALRHRVQILVIVLMCLMLAVNAGLRTRDMPVLKIAEPSAVAAVAIRAFWSPILSVLFTGPTPFTVARRPSDPWPRELADPSARRCLHASLTP